MKGGCPLAVRLPGDASAIVSAIVSAIAPTIIVSWATLHAIAVAQCMHPFDRLLLDESKSNTLIGSDPSPPNSRKTLKDHWDSENTMLILYWFW